MLQARGRAHEQKRLCYSLLEGSIAFPLSKTIKVNLTQHLNNQEFFLSIDDQRLRIEGSHVAGKLTLVVGMWQRSDLLRSTCVSLRWVFAASALSLRTVGDAEFVPLNEFANVATDAFRTFCLLSQSRTQRATNHSTRSCARRNQTKAIRTRATFAPNCSSCLPVAAGEHIVGCRCIVSCARKARAEPNPSTAHNSVKRKRQLSLQSSNAESALGAIVCREVPR